MITASSIPGISFFSSCRLILLWIRHPVSAVSAAAAVAVIYSSSSSVVAAVGGVAAGGSSAGAVSFSLKFHYEWNKRWF